MEKSISFMKVAFATVIYAAFSLQSIKSVIIITSPKDLREKFVSGKIDSSYATFGFNPYGYTISGSVAYSVSNKNADLACNYDLLNQEYAPLLNNTDKRLIVMVDRGDCFFVEKVQNIQKLGALAAIIINDQPNQKVEDIIMSGNPTMDIVIPAILISREDGTKLKEYMIQNPEKQLNFDIDFQIEHKSNTVTVDVFTTELNDAVYNLFAEFEAREIPDKLGNNFYNINLAKNLKFNHHFLTFQDYQFDSNVKQRTSSDKCLGGGKYCLFQEYENPVSSNPKESVRLNILFRCFNIDANKKSRIDLYFKSLNNFYTQCIRSPVKDVSLSCAYKTMFFNDVDIKTCYDESFDTTDKEKKELANNKLLDDDIKASEDLGVQITPSIFVNKVPYYGTISINGVTEAVCAGIKKKPEVCYTEGGFQKSSDSGKVWIIVVTILALVIGVSVIVVMLCKKCLDEDVKSSINSSELDLKVNSVVTNYLALREKN